MTDEKQPGAGLAVSIDPVSAKQLFAKVEDDCTAGFTTGATTIVGGATTGVDIDVEATWMVDGFVEKSSFHTLEISDTISSTMPPL